MQSKLPLKEVPDYIEHQQAAALAANNQAARQATEAVKCCCEEKLEKVVRNVRPRYSA